MEGNKGVDSLNLHWRFNCRNRPSSGFTTVQPYLNRHCCSLQRCTSLSLLFTLPPSAQHGHTSICVANWFGVLSCWDPFFFFSFVRTVTFSAVLTRLTRLTVPSETQKCQYKTESSNRLKRTEQDYNRNSNNFNHFKLSLVRPQCKKMLWQSLS